MVLLSQINGSLFFYRYVDFTSLYPWCNKNTYNVVGHPQIITENFADISTYFGLIKCTVLPPRGLFHPVLPYPTKDKLMFPLCKTCADTLNQNPCTHTDEERAILGTWCHVELMKAIEKGYEVLEIHEVWHWEETTDELFKGYVDTFLKLKQEASGYPKHCVTDEQNNATSTSTTSTKESVLTQTRSSIIPGYEHWRNLLSIHYGVRKIC